MREASIRLLYDARRAAVFRPPAGVNEPMAEIQITCPECGNQRGVPDDLVGKKIKCKKCQSVFTVKAPAAKPAPKPPAKPAKPAAKPASAIPIKDEEDDPNPYKMREENLAARCPFCADLLDPPDAKICLHCGYDMTSRKRVEKKIVYETTFVDYLVWHLSTIACFLIVVAVVAVVVVIFINSSDWFENDFIPVGAFNTWIIIMALFVCWFAGRFVFRKIVWRLHPPEHEKKDEYGDLEDEED
jgi:hypothetical protein